MKRIMKRIILLSILMACIITKVYPQAKSLTVDCQTPGWLSSMINYGDQQTLENLTVTGYLNGTDIKFIRELNLNRSLSGVIDLEKANIVSGGESYGTFSNYYIGTYNPTTIDNTITDFMFANLKPIRKVVLPESITSFNSLYNGGYHQFTNTTVDTLIINGNMESIGVGGGYDNKFWGVRCLFLPDGIKNLELGYILDSSHEIYLPSTLEWVDGRRAGINETMVFHCSSLQPNIIKIGSYTNNNYALFNSGTIYVPKGTKDLYEQSIFSKLNIIEDIRVEGISLDESEKLYVGDVVKLEAQINPTDALNKSIKWCSTNEKVAKISEDGTITAIEFGTVDITATTIDGGFQAVCKVDVYDHSTGIKIDESINLHVGQQYDLNAYTLPLSTSDGNISYNCDDESVATVSEKGVVKAKKKGTCTITASTVDGGYTAECAVTVLQPVETVTMEKHSVSLKVGESESLFAQIAPATADNKTILWSSSDEQLAAVSKKGEVTALKAGTVWIKAISEDNAEAKDSCKVTILQPVTGITLNYSTIQLEGIGSSFELEATIQPDNASNKTIKWKSSDESVCVVSNGVVVVVGTGTCVIIATTEDGGYLATCTVTVIISTSISSIDLSGNGLFHVYDTAGTRKNKLSRGINLIRFADGITKKVQIR